MERKLTHLALLCLIGIATVSKAQFVGSNPIQQASPGNVAIGSPTYNPSALLQVRNGSILFEGGLGSTPVSGAGTRLMWIPAKNAFRAGAVTSTQWDDGNIGANSFAVGYDNQASGPYTFACGDKNIVSGNGSFACGINNNSIGNWYSFAAGSGNVITSPLGGFGIGQNNSVSGSFASAFGRSNNSPTFCQFTIGSFNLNTTGNASGWVSTDPLFIIGNGQSSTTRSNAITVLKNGNTGFGIVSPIDKIDVNGNIRLNNNTLYLSGDANHGLKYANIFATTGAYSTLNVDGPVLFGWAGGALGISNNATKTIVLSWNQNGNVGIGTPNPGTYKLAVEGIIGARALKITLAPWADFVFDKNYKLRTLTEVEDYIKKYRHLPEIPSAEEIERNGLDIAEIQAKQMQKIEELTLYILELNKKLEVLQQETSALKKVIDK